MKKNKCGTIIQNINYCGCCEDEDDDADNVYSTEETVCGTWIDGKKIYRKVIEGKLASVSGVSYVFENVSELKIDRVINLTGNFCVTSGEDQGTFPTAINFPQGPDAAVHLFYHVTTKELRYHFQDADGHYSDATAYVILEYTKQDIEPTA